MSSLVIVLAFVVLNGDRVAAQQMADMPYDLHFIDMMIMHHQEGIEMAQMAQTKSQNPKVKTFATKTAADQQKDIEELQGHRNHWYAGKPLMDHAMMESMMASMHPGMKMDMEDTRRKLLAATGATFDRLFLDTMIHHHMMAIDMANDAKIKAEHPEIKELVAKALLTQQAEITEMNLLKGVKTSKPVSKSKPKPKSKTPSKHVH